MRQPAVGTGSRGAPSGCGGVADPDGQTAVCNRHHAIDRQLCRWLSMRLARLPSNQLVMREELIARMLGVPR
jgi:hypothetical protein